MYVRVYLFMHTYSHTQIASIHVYIRTYTIAETQMDTGGEKSKMRCVSWRRCVRACVRVCMYVCSMCVSKNQKCVECLGEGMYASVYECVSMYVCIYTQTKVNPQSAYMSPRRTCCHE